MNLKDLKALSFTFRYVKSESKLLILLVLSIVFFVILSVVSLLPPYFSKLAFDKALINKNLDLLTKYVLIIAGSYFLKSILNYVCAGIFTFFNQKVILAIKNDLVSRILRLPLEFFSSNESGYIISRFREVDSLSAIFSLQSFKLILSIFEFFGAAFIMFTMDVKLTIILMLLIPVFYVISHIFSSTFTKVTDQTMEKGAVFQGKFQQSISGVEEIKRLNLEEKEAENITKTNKEYAKLMIKYSIVTALGSEVIMLLSSLVGVLLLYLGGRSIVQENMTIGTYIAFSGYFAKLYAPVINWSLSIYMFKPAFVALDRIEDFFLKYPLEDDENKIKVESIEYIKMENINFAYPNREALVLKNFNLDAKIGDKVLLKGPNGSGKSTVIRLILGFFENYDGRILINGTELRELNKKSLKNKISIVSQKIFLFNDTLENNIKISGEVEPEKYEEALKKSGLKDFIEKLPLKDKTLVGENGMSLSGGEIHKVAIARAILKTDAQVFIFDEATAHLDVETKELVKKFIKEELNDKLCIIIDHSDYFDNLCNKIVDLDTKTIKRGEMNE